MHWIIQNDCRLDNLITSVRDAKLDLTIINLSPFAMDTSFTTNVKSVVFGSMSLVDIAKSRGWLVNRLKEESGMPYDKKHLWYFFMFNRDGVVCKFKDVIQWRNAYFPREFFIRPLHDTKAFAGGILNSLDDWHAQVMQSDDLVDFNGDTLVLINKVQNIEHEARYWVVNGKVITGSTYNHSKEILTDFDFPQYMTSLWNPAEAYCLDIVNHKHIMEINTINCSGLYAADTDKIVHAIERLR